MKKVIVLGTILLLFSFLSCSISRDFKKANSLIEKAIIEIDGESRTWSNTVEKLTNDLPKEAKKIIGTDLQKLGNNLIGATGAEFKCNIDFFRARIKRDLRNLSRKLLGKEPIATSPAFCTLSLPSIDLNKNIDSQREIVVFGYDFYGIEEKLSLFQVNNNESLELPNERITVNTNYMLTLKLGNIAKELFEKKIQFLTLNVKNDIDTQCKIAVHQWEQITETINNYKINPITYIPPNHDIDRSPKGNLYKENPLPFGKKKLTKFCHKDCPEDYSIQGDRDFDTGYNDPVKVKLKTELRIVKNKIQARLYIKAIEQKGDKTGICGWLDWKDIYTADENYTVESFSPNNNTETSFEETKSDELRKIQMGNESISYYDVALDTKGDDRGAYTKIELNFNPLTIKIKPNKPKFMTH